MSRIFKHSIYIKPFLIFILLLCVILSLPGIVESWKLRDLGSKSQNVTTTTESTTTIPKSFKINRDAVLSKTLPKLIRSEDIHSSDEDIDDDTDDADDEIDEADEDEASVADEDDDTIVAEDAEDDTIVAEDAEDDTIVAEDAEDDTIVAEDAEDDTIVADHEDDVTIIADIVDTPKNAEETKAHDDIKTVPSGKIDSPQTTQNQKQQQNVPPPLPKSESETTAKFVFERVRPSHYDLPKPRPKVSHPDVELEQKEEKEIKEEEKVVESMLSPIWKVVNEFIFGENEVKSAEEETQGFFEWLSSYRKKEVEKEQIAIEPIISSTGENWLSYLNRKPFNIILNYFWDENLTKTIETHSTNDVENDADDDHIDKTRSPLTTKTFEELLLKIPSFVPNYTKIENVNCKRMGQIFLRQVRGQKLWAVQMLDANSKIPSGLLRGNANQFGDFDLCTDIRTKIILKEDKSLKIKGKYCLANIDIRATDEEMKLAVHLMQGRNLLRSRFEDSSHFLPRFSTLKWGICVPHGCTHDDAAVIVHDILTPYNVTGIKLFVDVTEEGCYVKTKTNWSELTRDNWKVSGTIAYFLFFIALVIVASLNDYWKQLKLDLLFAPDTSKEQNLLRISSEAESKSEALESVTQTEEERKSTLRADPSSEGLARQIILAFSLKRTTAILFGSESNEEHIIDSIYGLKAIGTIMLFITYKFLMIGHQPFTNRAYLTEILTTPPSILLRGFILYTDLLLLISGFLAAQSLSRELNIRKQISIHRQLFGRFFRVTPPVVAVILFTAWIFEHIGNGPQWGSLVNHNADLCKENIWPNFVHLTNWIPFEIQCSPYLVGISIDMQLYLIVPLVLWLLYKNESAGVTLIGIITTFSIGIRYSDTISERLSAVVYHGIKLSQLYRTINISFTSPVHRVATYLFGVGFAVLLNNLDKSFSLSKALNTFGWITSLCSIIWCFYIPANLAYKDYVYTPNEAADYAAWAPILWSIAICWILYVCTLKGSTLLEQILTIKPLVVLGKISFEIYLIQFLVLFYFTASTRSLESFNFWSCLNFLEIFVIVTTAIIFALFVGIPLQIIRKIIVAGGSGCESDITENIPSDIECESKFLLDSEPSTSDDVEDEKSQSSRRRVSWSDKVITDEPVIFRRPPTPVWLKDDDNVPDFWNNEDGDDNETLDASNCNGVEDGSENREDEPIEISLSDLDDDMDIPQFSDEETEIENKEEDLDEE